MIWPIQDSIHCGYQRRAAGVFHLRSHTCEEPGPTACTGKSMMFPIESLLPITSVSTFSHLTGAVLTIASIGRSDFSTTNGRRGGIDTYHHDPIIPESAGLNEIAFYLPISRHAKRNYKIIFTTRGTSNVMHAYITTQRCSADSKSKKAKRMGGKNTTCAPNVHRTARKWRPTSII